MKNLKKQKNTKEVLPINNVICGDASNELSKMQQDSVDLIITSPPYFDQRNYDTDSDLEIGHESDLNNYFCALGQVFFHCFRICKPTGNIVFNIGDSYKDKSLQLVPYRFVNDILGRYKNDGLKLINNITWVKSNPTPRQYSRRLINATEPFFHFTKSDNYYYNRDKFLDEKIKKMPITDKKGQNYCVQIQNSDLSSKEKLNALLAVAQARVDITEGKITDFRMKIRGIHKKAFGGQSGGRNDQMEKNGFTLIRMYGNKLKRDVIVSPVANTKDIDHPAVFPLNVIEELILLLSKEGDIVLDPFCGSGTVCVASKKLNRKYIGIDLSKKYCQDAIKRLKGTE